MLHKNYTYRGLVFNHQQQEANLWVDDIGYAFLVKIEFSKRYDSSTKNIEQNHGLVASETYYRGMDIFIKGHILCRDTIEKTARENRFLAIQKLDEAFNVITNKGFSEFFFEDGDGTTKSVMAKIEDYQPPKPRLVEKTDSDAVLTDFTIRLLVTSPYKKSTTTITESITKEPITGFSYPIEFPFSYINTTGTLIQNDGLEAETIITIDVTAPTTNPTIINLTEEYITWLQIENTFTTGDQIVINSAENRVYVNGNEYLSGAKLGSKRIKLAPGDNYLLLTDNDDLHLDNITATLEYNKTELV